MPRRRLLDGAVNISAVADWLLSRPMNWLTSAAADRAARMDAAFGGGTGFQRFSFELQYLSVRRGASASGLWRAGAFSSESFT